MARQTILYLNHSAQMSGAEASLRSLLLGLRQIGAPFDSVVALPGDGPLSSLLRDEGVNVAFAPLRRIQRPRGLIDGMSAVLHVLQTAPHICRLATQTGANIVHSNSTTAHLVGGLAAERSKIPAIWHCRDLVSLSRIGAQLAAKSNVVIAISGCVAEALERDGVPREKIAVVHNGLDPDEWRPKEHSPLRDILGISDEAFVFGMAGQLVPWKNHGAFIAAAAALSQDEGMGHVRFLMVGGDLWDEKPEYVNSLREEIKSAGLTDRFHIVPNQMDAVSALNAFDCLVHPSQDEPFGRVIIESMALTKPVIAMNVNGPREIITHEYNGLLVAPEENAGLAQAMRRIVTESELREVLSRHARQTVEDRFHIETHVSKIADIYTRLGA